MHLQLLVPLDDDAGDNTTPAKSTACRLEAAVLISPRDNCGDWPGEPSFSLLVPQLSGRRSEQFVPKLSFAPKLLPKPSLLPEQLIIEQTHSIA